MPEKPKKPFNFWHELKRRKVFSVAAMYAASAFIVLEAVDIVFPRWGFPDWTVNLVILLLILGFVVAAILAWIFDITPEGIQKTESVDEAKDTTIDRRRLRISDVIITILLIVVVILAYPKIFKKDKFQALRDEQGRISVAIMPFENLTGDTTLNFWQRGIPEILINDLGASEELLVMNSQAMSEVLGSMGQTYTASIIPSVANEAAKKISTSVYITGSYQRTEDKMRIMVKIINTKDETIMWTDRVNGGLESNYLDLGDKISNLVKNNLEIEALKKEAGYEYRDAFTQSSQAYRFYIEGLNSFLNQE